MNQENSFNVVGCYSEVDGAFEHFYTWANSDRREYTGSFSVKVPKQKGLSPLAQFLTDNVESTSPYRGAHMIKLYREADERTKKIYGINELVIEDFAFPKFNGRETVANYWERCANLIKSTGTRRVKIFSPLRKTKEFAI